MRKRVAATLLLASVALISFLWPLPQVEAERHIAFYSKMKAEWERTDPAKSENPTWTAQAKSESLSRIEEVLADPDAVLYGAMYRWALWLTCVAMVAAAGITAWRGSTKWPWLAFAALLLFMWLEQPWISWRLFFSQFEFLADRAPERLVLMMLFDIVVAAILVAAAVLGLFEMRTRRHAL
jgi:hypothetical protein